jgi:hypothetical protein
MSDITDTEIIYTVLGKPEFKPVLLKSIESIRRTGYLGTISVLTDLGSSGWDRRDVLAYDVRQLAPPFVAERFGGKTLVDRYTGAGKVLAVDCDIVAVAPFDEIWCTLDSREFAACRDVCPTLWSAVENDIRCKPQNNPADLRDTLRLCGVDAPYFNGGVFAFRRTPAVTNLFALWHEEWKKYRGSNQYTLLRALKRAGITPRILDSAYNADARCYETQEAAVSHGAKLVHFYGRSLEDMLRF